MKLPNFLESENLNALRTKLGVELKEWECEILWNPIESDFAKNLKRLGEIVVSAEEIENLDDGPFIIDGQAFVVYIRDIADYGRDLSLPKVHTTRCGTLSQMLQRGRYNSRYVATKRFNEPFLINIVQGGRSIKEKREELDICKNCLSTLNYKGYNDYYSQRPLIFKEFTFDEFFASYKVNVPKPTHTPMTQGLNKYSENYWSDISKNYKERIRYICEECGLNLKNISMQGFMEVHHIDANKSNNDISNLKALCIRCHSKEPMHSHIRSTTRYKRFIDLVGR